MPAASDHLLRARKALIKQRDEISRAIADLDRLIQKVGGEAQTNGQTSSARRPQEGTVRAEILAVLGQTDHAWRVTDLLESLHDRDVQSSDASVRSILNKMVSRGELSNPTRGHYATPSVADVEADEWDFDDDPEEPSD